jgi:hypothetical protein
MGANGGEEAGRAVWEALSRLVEELLERKPAAQMLRRRIEALDVRMPFHLRGERADPERFARELAASLDRQLDLAVLAAAAFVPGHAYCHRCGRPDCEHSSPPSSRHVFASYAPTGQPRWIDFAQHCLERKHPDVDRLYGDPPALLSIVDGRPTLSGAMVGAIRRPGHELIGQVAAGFFPVRTRAEEGRGVLAVTLQIVATGSGHGLALNLLGRPPFGESLDRVWERHDELPWRKAVRWAQNAIDTVPARRRTTRRGTPGEEGIDRRVDGILRGVARRLEREQRGRARRTTHAEERRASGARPTHKAVDDARAADVDAFLVDERSGTVVVLGDRGRTHFFTPDGRLVSSVRYSREAIERKVKLEVWRKATAEVAEALRAKLPA